MRQVRVAMDLADVDLALETIELLKRKTAEELHPSPDGEGEADKLGMNLFLRALKRGWVGK